jgi:hypothetical protein
MTVLQEREIRDGFDIEEKRTGKEEKVGEHLVAVIIGREVGKAVEYIVTAPSVFFDDVVDRIDEFLESLDRVELVDLRLRVVGYDLWMARKTKIDNLLPATDSVIVKMLGESLINFDRIRMPDDIISGQHSSEDFI